MERTEARSLAGWILAAGFALASLGLVARSSSTVAAPQGGQTQDPNPLIGTSSFPASSGGYGTADSNGSMIAVTGLDVTGGSLLFLVDTESRHLTVYQATGGTKSTMNIKWVGARNIDLDLQVDGWNDKSEHSYKSLAGKFDSQGSAVTLPKK
jgi:hypothetical protein